MKDSILILSCMLAMSACSKPEQPAEKPLEEVSTAAIEEDVYTPIMMQMGQMIEPSFTSSTEFDDLFNCYLVDNQGNVESVTSTAAIDTYHNILDGSTNSISQLPVYETKEADRVVLLVKEKKTWAHILLDKSSLTILDVKFPDGSNTTKLGSKTDQFSEQFAGSMVSFSPQNFELTPWEVDPKGEVIVDGVSGATKVCQAAVDMLNNQLPFYQKYLTNTR